MITVADDWNILVSATFVAHSFVIKSKTHQEKHTYTRSLHRFQGFNNCGAEIIMQWRETLVQMIPAYTSPHTQPMDYMDRRLWAGPICSAWRTAMSWFVSDIFFRM